MATTRNQPQYDFITGASSAPQRPPSRQGQFRASQATRADADNEDLRAQIHKLQYEVESLKQEREATNLRHDEELRRTQSKADADFKRAQALESSSNTAGKKAGILEQELEDLHERFARERGELESKLRTVQSQNDSVKEEVEDLRSELSAQERQSNHTVSELRAELEHLRDNNEQATKLHNERHDALEEARHQLEENQTRIGSLENEVIRLKTQTGDADTLATIKRELADQVAHIQRLEATNIDQKIELKQLREQQKAVEVVEEEKRALESKVEMMYDLRKQLSEAQLQKQILEDERSAWSAYLENMSSEEEDLKFERPEDLAKAYIQERLERVTLVDTLGKVAPELNAKEEIILSLEQDKATLQREMEAARSGEGTTTGSDAKAKARIERQRTLAIKEADYLRAQLETFDMEKREFQPEQYDAEKSKRITELEGLIDGYRSEIQTLHADLGKLEEQLQGSTDGLPSPAAGSKRSRESLGEGTERMGELTRKNRTLQDTVSELQTAKTLLEKEVSVQKSQLKSVKARSSTRVLELRANPTAEAEAIKLDTLNKLRAENVALLAQLEQQQQQQQSSKSKSSSTRPSSRSTAAATANVSAHRTVPHASLERLRADMDAKDAQIASSEKHLLRLKQIFGTKSSEFREAVASILGWKLDFLPNGRVRVRSMFHPGEKDESTGEEGNSIVFDGENGTMKVSGGPQSAFAGEIRSLIEFWVEGRKEIPCFLAACTLEFWEKSTRAAA